MDVDNEVPQWKKDLIARLRNQNRTVASAANDNRQLYSPQHSSCRQPSLSESLKSVSSGSSASDVGDVVSGYVTTNTNSGTSRKKLKMVQERVWKDNKRDSLAKMVSENYNNGYHKDGDSDDSEDLHYGPGIVKKLKNKYLSLALRESNNRPSILHMRKATSLENLLEDDCSKENAKNQRFRSRLNGNDTARSNIPNRYRNAARGEMKRARSVEAISRFDNNTSELRNDVKPNRQSLHEEMLISVEDSGNGFPSEIPYKKMPDNEPQIINNISTSHRINRPKRIQPLMSTKEKPPADFVKQTKMIFERAETRLRKPTAKGDVAAKVDSFNNIIVKAKDEANILKKPPIKQTKPVLNDKNRSNTRSTVAKPVKNFELVKVPKKETHDTEDLRLDVALTSPIPDVSRIDNKGVMQAGKPMSETPDLLLTSTPLPTTKSTTEKFLREEIRNTSPAISPMRESPKKPKSPLVSPNRVKPASPLLSPIWNRPASHSIKNIPSRIESKITATVLTYSGTEDEDQSGNVDVDGTVSKQPVFNFDSIQEHLPVNKNICSPGVPISQPLKINVNGLGESSSSKLRPRSPPKFSPPPPPKIAEQILTVTEIEKNFINTRVVNATKTETLTLHQPSVNVNISVEVVNTTLVPKKVKPRDTSSNAATTVFNFTSRKDVPDYISNDRSRSPGRPEMPKPGEGGIILIPGATILDEDEEIMRSLECPPSPCDVMFINDNILIDGKSSLNQKTKRMKLKLSFVDSGPDIFEYPSETSLLLDNSPASSPAQVGHSVPNLGGSYLANYTPKTTAEDFQPGITRSIPQNIPVKPDVTDVCHPDLLLEEIDKPFSSGSNADILF